MSKDKVNNQNKYQRGVGGETQQRGGTILTTNHGVPISDNQNTLKMGQRGPALLEDFVLREKIFHFDHERIPERIVHARGTGAHGYFECTHPIPELTKAALFQKKGEKTPLFCRISTVAGSKGSKDTPRDVRGFAVKFYTEQGNWDLVGNNMPVFFIQDAMKFPDLVHAVKPEADKGFPQAASAHDTFWDFVSLMPESMHTVLWLMSDRAIPRSLRMMEGFGVHTFIFENAQGETKLVKFHWKPKQGVQSTLWDEAVKISGADPDYHRRDMFESIQAGQYPEWELGIQVFDEEWAEQQFYDVLDATKLIPEEDVPVQIIGRMVLDRYPDNFFAETEQVAFLPTNIIPGIDFSNDPLLQGRLFSYLDTQKSRLGTTNFHQIPINAPKCPMHNFQRDGMMQTHSFKGRATYEPNGLAEVNEEAGPRATEQGFQTIAKQQQQGTDKLRVRAERFADHFSQPRLFYRSQTKIEQAHIVSAFVFELSKVKLNPVRLRLLAQLLNVDQELAKQVAAGLGIDLPQPIQAAKEPVTMPVADSLSILKAENPIAGRYIGVLLSEGADAAMVKKLQQQAQKSGVMLRLIAEKIGGVTLSDGSHLEVDEKTEGAPSVLFDAIALLLTKDEAQRLAKQKVVQDFISDAFAHLKAIAYVPSAQELLNQVGIVKDEFVVELGNPNAVIERVASRLWERKLD